MRNKNPEIETETAIDYNENPMLRNYFIDEYGARHTIKLYRQPLNPDSPINQMIIPDRRLISRKKYWDKDTLIYGDQKIITYGRTNASVTSTHYKQEVASKSLFYYPYESKKTRVPDLEANEFHKLSGLLIDLKALKKIIEYARYIVPELEVNYDEFTKYELQWLLENISINSFGAIKQKVDGWLNELKAIPYDFKINIETIKTVKKRLRPIKTYGYALTRRDRQLIKFYKRKIEELENRLAMIPRRLGHKRKKIKHQIREYEEWINRIVETYGYDYEDTKRACENYPN